MRCPNCKSIELRKDGWRWRTIDGVRQMVQQFRCKGCGYPTVKPLENKPLPSRDIKGRFIKAEVVTNANQKV